MVDNFFATYQHRETFLHFHAGMDLNHDAPSASGLPARKITRHDLAAHFSLSLRTVDELTRKGVLPFYKINASVRYDLNEVETALRERYHVRAKKPKTTVSTARPLTA